MAQKKPTLHFVITAGGTREYLDPVRYISNASSGRMGYALAHAALKAGHKVTLITAPTALTPPRGADVVSVVSAADMAAAVKKYFNRCDGLIMAAAVADYTPVEKAKVKTKKEKGLLTLRLEPTEDILAWAGRHKKKQFVIGFALEDCDLKANAEKKLYSKNADMIIANTPAAIGGDSSCVYLKTPHTGWTKLQDKKDRLAKLIIRSVVGLI
ncbi:MAG: phosphopantothenoylcysteine decarboxylase [Planctomycetes bacterium]|nr:phosphopantothenoylcysteine decarboxylase [Planctomycetota bacterium]